MSSSTAKELPVTMYCTETFHARYTASKDIAPSVGIELSDIPDTKDQTVFVVVPDSLDEQLKHSVLMEALKEKIKEAITKIPPVTQGGPEKITDDDINRCARSLVQFAHSVLQHKHKSDTMISFLEKSILRRKPNVNLAAEAYIKDIEFVEPSTKIDEDGKEFLDGATKKTMRSISISFGRGLKADHEFILSNKMIEESRSAAS